MTHVLREVGFKCEQCGWCCYPDPEFMVDPDIYSAIKGEEIWAIGWILKRKADGRVETMDIIRIMWVYFHDIS
ncbi:MAG: hypothetical protein IBX40_01135 [Methanosarcinales archaeon]|nr:hypothetical protein [Methanosarcinales archaeon]